jgi:hypothetical protein
MTKCIICEKIAPYVVKGTSTFYCEEHAIEFFGDITYLVKAKEEAKRMKELIDPQGDADILVETIVSQLDEPLEEVIQANTKSTKKVN